MKLMDSFEQYLKKASNGNTEDLRGHHLPTRKISEEKEREVKSHIEIFTANESHIL